MTWITADIVVVIEREREFARLCGCELSTGALGVMVADVRNGVGADCVLLAATRWLAHFEMLNNYPRRLWDIDVSLWRGLVEKLQTMVSS